MIFFDIDNTLIDEERAVKNALKLFCTSTDELINVEPVALERIWSQLSEIYFSQFLQGKLTYHAQLKKRVQGLLAHSSVSEKVTETQTLQLVAHYLHCYQQSWVLFNDTISCLQSLDTPLGILSNGKGSQQRQKLTHTALKRYFQVEIYADEERAAKPSKTIFLNACKKAHIHPEKAWYVGDNFRSDIIGSYEAGLKPVWINRGKSPLPFSSTLLKLTILDSLDSLSSHLKPLEKS